MYSCVCAHLNDTLRSIHVSRFTSLLEKSVADWAARVAGNFDTSARCACVKNDILLWSNIVSQWLCQAQSFTMMNRDNFFDGMVATGGRIVTSGRFNVVLAHCEFNKNIISVGNNLKSILWLTVFQCNVSTSSKVPHLCNT